MLISEIIKASIVWNYDQLRCRECKYADAVYIRDATWMPRDESFGRRDESGVGRRFSQANAIRSFREKERGR